MAKTKQTTTKAGTIVENGATPTLPTRCATIDASVAKSANKLVDECIGKLYHFLSVNADEKKELRAQVQAQQRFSKDSVGGLGMGGIGRSAALSPTSPRASNTWKQPWERSEAQSPGASALSPMAKDIAMMDMSELRTELESLKLLMGTIKTFKNEEYGRYASPNPNIPTTPLPETCMLV